MWKNRQTYLFKKWNSVFVIMYYYLIITFNNNNKNDHYHSKMFYYRGSADISLLPKYSSKKKDYTLIIIAIPRASNK